MSPFSLGILGSARVASGATPGISYIGKQVDTASSASPSFSGVALGPTGTYALTVLAVVTRGTSGTSLSVSGVTVAGTSATKRSETIRSGTATVAWFDVPTPATSGTVAVTLSRTSEAGTRIFVYQIHGTASMPAYSTSFGSFYNSNTGTFSTGSSLTLPTGGALVLGAAMNENAPASITGTWSPTTQRDSTNAAYDHASTSSGDVTASGVVTVSVTWTTAGVGALNVVAYTRGA